MCSVSLVEEKVKQNEKGRNYSQLKEQEKNPEKTNETEINSLPDE